MGKCIQTGEQRAHLLLGGQPEMAFPLLQRQCSVDKEVALLGHCIAPSFKGLQIVLLVIK